MNGAAGKLVVVAIGAIDVGERLRQVDPDYVTWLAGDIAAHGLLVPIQLAKPPGAKRYALIAGAHRLAAFRQLAAGDDRYSHIDAKVFGAGQVEARGLEIAETLVRHELNALDRATFLAEYKALYLIAHPETKAGVAGGRARQGHANEIVSFAYSAAAKAGITPRAIQLAVEMHERLGPEVRDRVRGTWLARNQAQLIALSRAKAERRGAILDLLLSDDEDRPKTVAAAEDIVLDGGRSRSRDENRIVNRIVNAYLNAPRAVQRRVYGEIRGHERTARAADKAEAG